MEENTNQDSTQEQIFENIRVHKEVLQQVKWQPWSMKRKLKLVQQAKSYIARHEGELQERFASAKSTKDIVARIKIVVNTVGLHFDHLTQYNFKLSFCSGFLNVGSTLNEN